MSSRFFQHYVKWSTILKRYMSILFLKIRFAVANVISYTIKICLYMDDILWTAFVHLAKCNVYCMWNITNIAVQWCIRYNEDDRMSLSTSINLPLCGDIWRGYLLEILNIKLLLSELSFLPSTLCSGCDRS